MSVLQNKILQPVEEPYEDRDHFRGRAMFERYGCRVYVTPDSKDCYTVHGDTQPSGEWPIYEQGIGCFKTAVSSAINKLGELHKS